jgi:hypothetical protein
VVHRFDTNPFTNYLYINPIHTYYLNKLLIHYLHYLCQIAFSANVPVK